jgi:hypothetical protein
MNNRNLILGMVILFTFSLFAGCKQDEFNYKMAEVEPGDVTQVYFSAGSEMLIADGKATLKFIVETYKDYKKEDGTVAKKLFDYHTLPEGSVKIYEETTNKEVGFTYSTTTFSATNPRFYAKVGNVKSAVKEVRLRPNPAPLPKLYVDVIFHVWELNPTNVAYDLSSFQPTNYADIINGLKIMNDIINNKIGNAPNAAAANIEFRLAAKNQAGQDLAFPGYNRIVYSDEIKKVPTAVSISPQTDFPDYINKNLATYIWNPKLYLNVHVLPSGSSNSFSNAMPAKQLPAGPGQTLIPGITGIAANEDDFVNSFTTSTLFMPNTLFRPGFERRIEIFSFIGAFYGLFATSAYNTTRFHSDFCEDTPLYEPAVPPNDYFFALKTGINGDKFVIENAMDDSRYPSSRNSITLDQVTRMRAVMTRCPGRMNAKTQ